MAAVSRSEHLNLWETCVLAGYGCVTCYTSCYACCYTSCYTSCFTSCHHSSFDSCYHSCSHSWSHSCYNSWYNSCYNSVIILVIIVVIIVVIILVCMFYMPPYKTDWCRQPHRLYLTSPARTTDRQATKKRFLQGKVNDSERREIKNKVIKVTTCFTWQPVYNTSGQHSNQL